MSWEERWLSDAELGRARDEPGLWSSGCASAGGGHGGFWMLSAVLGEGEAEVRAASALGDLGHVSQPL